MFCLNCGMEISDAANFCAGCGTKVGIVTPLTPLTHATVDTDTCDMDELCKQFRDNKIEIIKFLHNTKSISLSDAKSQVDNYYINKPKKTFGQRLMEQSNEINAATAREKIERTERINQLEKDGVCYCPKCHSTSVSGNKKGFGIGKAVVGAAMTGGIGLVAGNLGAKKVRVTCLKCGHQWWAGK